MGGVYVVDSSEQIVRCHGNSRLTAIRRCQEARAWPVVTNRIGKQSLMPARLVSLRVWLPLIGDILAAIGGAVIGRPGVRPRSPLPHASAGSSRRIAGVLRLPKAEPTTTTTTTRTKYH